MTETHQETGLPIEKCPGRGDHSVHNWNIYDPTKVKLSRVNPDGDRTCLGHNPFAGITYPSGEVTDARAMFEEIDWDARLRDAVAKTLAERDRRRNERADFKRRRDYGLKQRYAAKEARNRGSVGTSHERNDMTKDQIAQETAEYIAAHAPTEPSPAGVVVRYVGEERPPTNVDDIKADLLAGRVWISWLDELVSRSMREIQSADA